MALICRLFVILFAFPVRLSGGGADRGRRGDVSRIQRSRLGPIDQGAINVVLGFGFVFVSGFALLPALIVAL